MGEMDLKKAEYYTNRELSWLGFNNRILGQTEVLKHYRIQSG